MIIQPTRWVLMCAVLFSVVAFATTAAARPESRTLTGVESGFRCASLPAILRCLPWN